MGRVAVEAGQKIAEKAVRTRIKGIVQGVGFRPYVYNLALAFDLKGFVSNTSDGVYMEIEGPADTVDAFHKTLPEKKPPLAHIVSMEVSEHPVQAFSDFTIHQSEERNQRNTLISPDVCVCEDCLREMFDPKDRRYQYPFINCTNCGPRYTIIMDIPYDRPYTAMKDFKMCPDCYREYHDPADRRFHAQPNACWKCGPLVRLWDASGTEIETDAPVVKARELLKQGHIVAVKGLGGFHLAVDATNNDAVKRLRKRKNREEKPLALMCMDMERVRRIAMVSPDEERLLTSIQRPIVVLKKGGSSHIADEVSPRNRYFGIMLPYAPLHFLLLNDDLPTLVMTSGNISEEPIAIDNQEATCRLKDIADFFLNHNRDIYLRSDDSIVRFIDGKARQIRRSRGYVPVPVFLKEPLAPILACGAEWKNTICLTREDQAFLSQHIGDLENLETLNFFEMTIGHLKRILEIDPRLIAYDLHPDYLSTQYALKQTGMTRIGVQHHHAHVVSAMAEHGLDGSVIGIALDGTGYGTDGKIWGGEVLVAEKHRFERFGHINYLPLPGGAAAIKKPWRMAVSALFHAYGEAWRDLHLPFLEGVSDSQVETVVTMARQGINTPLTSSCGRLFDAVAAMAGVRNHVAYEGQAAVELEAVADNDRKRVYPFDMERDDGMIIKTASMIRSVVDDIQGGVPMGLISATFHNTLVRVFVAMAEAARRARGLDRVALSGGCFQNRRLLEDLTQALVQEGFTVYSQAMVPTNDGGISLGQAVAAHAMVEAGIAENE